MPPPDPPQGGISTREAAAILGTSTSDVLRRIRAGTLRAERFERAGGTYYRVYLDPPQDTPDAHQEPPEPRQDASEAIAALRAIIEEERAERRQVAAENADLRERIGRAEANAQQERARADRLQAELDRERNRSWWQRAWGIYPRES